MTVHALRSLVATLVSRPADRCLGLSAIALVGEMEIHRDIRREHGNLCRR